MQYFDSLRAASFAIDCNCPPNEAVNEFSSLLELYNSIGRLDGGF